MATFSSSYPSIGQINSHVLKCCGTTVLPYLSAKLLCTVGGSYTLCKNRKLGLVSLFSVPGTAVNLKVTLYFYHSLRSKRFRSVSEQRRTEEWDSQF